MNNLHFAIPEIYGETLSYYELLRKLVNKTNELIKNYNTVPEQIAEAVANLDASQLFSAVLEQIINSIATDNTKSTNAVKVYKKHDLLYASFNDTVNLYESLIDFTTGTETELIIGTNIREVNISELFIELRKLIVDETLAREQGDNLLQQNINTETSERVQADNLLQQNINTETSERVQADNLLQQNINTETSERVQGDNTKVNKSDVLTLQEIQESSDLNGKVASASALYNVSALKGLLIENITAQTDITQLDSGLYFITGAYYPINGVPGAFNTIYLINEYGVWRNEFAISSNANAIYYRIYNKTEPLKNWTKITGVLL